MESIDRIEFYEKLKYCKTRIDIEELIYIIDNDDLRELMLDKYNQILEFNKSKIDEKLVKDIIKILEFTYLNFEKKNQQN